MSQQNHQVVILGAGYAGVIATNRLLGSLTTEERSRTRLTVVNPRPGFVERIRLHELAAGSRQCVTIPLPQVLHEDAEVLVGHAVRIDAERRTVQVLTADREVALDYDQLVYAVGSGAAAPIPGARDHAFLLGDLAGAEAAAPAIAEAPQHAALAVVGGGLTGIEAAGELAQQHPDAEVTLYCLGPVAESMRPAARRSLRRTLQRLGVRIVEHTRVLEIQHDALVLEDESRASFDVCLVAASFDVPDLASSSGLPVDPLGRLLVDQTLRCVTEPSIVGAGDAILAPGSVAAHLRMGCAAALPLGGHAAETVLSSIRGTTPESFSMGYVVQCVSLGRRRGYVQVVHADDSPRRLHVGGRMGAWVKEKVCTLVVEAPVRERVEPGAYSWPRGPRTAALS